MKRLILKEARCLNHARHRHIVRFETAFFSEFPDKSKSFMGIVMDRAEGDIGPYLRSQASPTRISGWFQSLANVVAYVHGLGITHRDIKPPNILIQNGKVLLADFGISKMGLVRTLPTTQPNDPRARTPEYAAPEVEDGSTRGRSADIFSLGAVFLEMLVAYSYPDKRANLHATAFGNSSSFAKKLPEVHQWMSELQTEDRPWEKMIIHICKDMMKPDRDERPDINKVYRMITSIPPPNQPVPQCCQHMLAGTDVTDNQRLIEACKNGNINEVRTLVNGKRASPRTVGALHQASAHDSNEIVQYLLSQGANVNLCDYSNQTALHCAAGYGHAAMVKTLLRYRANVNLQD
ncbi:kinase-like domain-containing protein, partial [Hypoxylon sp. FL1857]